MDKNKLTRNGDCLSSALEYFLGHSDTDTSNLRLVHGFVMNPIMEAYMPHAWCEDEHFVYENANGRRDIFHKPMYYESGEIKEQNTFRYTRAEAIVRAARHWTYGFWEKVFNDWYESNDW